MKNKMKKYEGFTIIEMIIVMGIMFVIFLAFASVLSSLMRASNSVSARMVVREEGEYMAELIRKHIRNANYDALRIYHRDEPEIIFEEIGGVIMYNSVISLSGITTGPRTTGTEIHFRPSTGAREVVCIGYFQDAITQRGYLIRTKTPLVGTWGEYQPQDCFNSSVNQDFRNNFMVLNSDLADVTEFGINVNMGTINNYYTFNIRLQPQLGLGGYSNYNETNLPEYVKAFVVQTRAYRNW